MENLNIIKRECKNSHSARKERRKGMTPGILYGKNKENFLFEIGDLELNDTIKKIGEHGLVNVTIDGNEEKALIKEVQRDPVRHNIIHLDLEAIDEDQRIITEVPINFQGEGMIKGKGGILQKEKLSVKIRCKADEIPKSINANLKDLNIGDIIKIQDLEIGEDITFIEPIDSVVVSVSYSNYVEEEVDDDSPVKISYETAKAENNK